MNGIEFYKTLKTGLQPNDYVGEYKFVKWLKNGNLQFEINKKQKKSIPSELIMLAFHIRKRNKKIKNKVEINQKLIKITGHSDWCFLEVILFLLDNY